MAAVFSKSIAFISIIVLGYLLKRGGLFKREDFYVFSRLVIWITLPAAIVSNFSRISMDSSLLIMCLIGIFVNVLMAAAGYFMYTGRSREDKVFGMLNLSGYNIGSFTMPFVQSFLGPIGFAVTSLFDAGNAVMCTGGTFSAATAVSGTGEKPSIKGTVKCLFRSIPFDAYVIMTLLAIVQIRLPETVLSFAATVGGANAFLALFMIGIGFEFYMDQKKLKQILVILFARYTIALALSLAFYFLAPFSHEIRQTLAIIMWGPISSVSPVYTGMLKGDVELSSVINSLSILISIITITIALIIFI